MISRTSKTHIENLLSTKKDWKILDIGCGYSANNYATTICDVQDLSNFYKTKYKLSTYKTILILGDMLELGKNAKEMHFELIPMIKKVNPDLLITVGPYTKKISNELKELISCKSYLTFSPLLKIVTEFVKPNQIILVKGSNGIGLWNLIPVFRNINQEKPNVA